MAGSTPAHGDGSHPVQETVRARLFELVDEEGNVRAELGIEPDGFPGLNLIDKDGVGRIGLTLIGGSPGLLLLDGNGMPRTLLRVGGPDETSSLALMGEDAKPRATLSVERDGSSFLTLADPGGMRRVSLTAFGEDGASALILHDRDGNEIWRAP